MRYFLAGAVLLTVVSSILAEVPPGESSGASYPVVEVHDLAALTPEAALRLNGKRAVFRIEITGRPAGLGAYTSPYPWCKCCEGAVGYAELPADVHATTGMTVDATMTVLHYKDADRSHLEGYYFILSGTTVPIMATRGKPTGEGAVG